MRISTSLRWLVVVAGAAMLLAVAAACAARDRRGPPARPSWSRKRSSRPLRSPARPSWSRKRSSRTVEVPGETVTKEVVKTVEVPGETIVVEKEVIKTVEVVKSVPVEVIKEVEVVGDRWVRNTAGTLVENPQYGGTVVGLGTDHPSFSPLGADPLTAGDAWHVAPLYETLMVLDWAKGPAGTGEWDNRYRLDATKIPGTAHREAGGELGAARPGDHYLPPQEGGLLS